MEKFSQITNVVVKKRGEDRPVAAGVESQPPAVDGMNRREFGIGVAANAVLGAIGTKLLIDHEQAKASEQAKQSDAIEKLVNEAVTEGESNSFYYNQSVEQMKKILNEQEEDIEYERGMKTPVENIDIIDAIITFGKLPGIESDVVRSELESLLPAIAYTESRFDLDAFNEDGDAFGPFQITPDVWEDHAEEDDRLESLESHIKVACRLIEQSYQHIMQTCEAELDLIKTKFFNGKENDFEKKFIAPVIVNAFTAGMGTMEDVVKKFAQNFTSADDLKIVTEEGEQKLTEDDVLIGMLDDALKNARNKNFGNKSKSYPIKVVAAEQIIDFSIAEHITKQKA